MGAAPHPVEQRLLDDAVARLANDGAFSVVFGGLPEAGGGIAMQAIRGNRAPLLGNLHVDHDRGLGGRALAERRARIANDYRASRHITHDYDREVLSEGIRTLLAVPVLVDGRVRGVLYGGVRRGAIEAVRVQPALQRASELAGELRMYDRVARIAGEVGEAPRRGAGAPGSQRSRGAPVAPGAVSAGQDGAAAVSSASTALPAAQLEELRATYAELRAISATVDDAALADRLHRLEDRLVTLTTPGDAPVATVHLSPRELDVLGLVGLGRTSGEIGAELGLTESTVKSYLASGMRKLEVRTRHEAVAAARRQGLLP